MPGLAGTQIINGQSYQIYSPEWYAAMNADKVHNAEVAGTAAGTGEAAKIKAVSPALQGLFGAIGLGGGSGTGSNIGGAGNGVPPAGSVSGPASVAPVDTTAATNARFAQAKDQVGQETGGALTGLRSALAGRGLLGSGAESRGTTNVIMKGQGELGDTTRQNAITDADLAQKNAETNFQGAVTQRGQDIQREQNVMQAQQAQAQLQLQQRQMSLQALQAALSQTVQAY